MSSSWELGSEVFIGRDPSDPGLALTPVDETISRNAAHLVVEKSRLKVTNTSSFAEIEVQHERGSRLLFPGEALETSGRVELVIRGEIFSHRIELAPSVNAAEPESPTGTRRLASMKYDVPAERRLSLIALCAARFEPDRFGSDLLSAKAISDLLTARGESVSPKAVNNKLQRIRDDVAHTLGVYLESREDLADWAIRNGHVTRSAVETLLRDS